MRKAAKLVISSVALVVQTALVFAETNNTYYTDVSPQDITTAKAPQQTSGSFSPFTGKITKNKVRMRVLPNTDSTIIKELKQGDLLIVVGETEDFYAVQAPSGIKGYIFRTYVLDNVVEASKVNVRQEPDMEAAVIGQLHTGERVNGTVSTLNNKWLEISVPETSRFYVSRDYVERIGDTSMMATIEKRRDEVNILLNSTYLSSQTEMQKSFPEIDLDRIYANFNKVINEYKDFPEQVARAKELISSIQDSYLQKKVAFLEAKTKFIQEDWQSKNSQLTEQMRSQQSKMSQMEQQLQRSKGAAPYIAQSSGANSNQEISAKMKAWIPAEDALYDEWSKTNNRSQEDFYREQNDQAVTLRGVIEPYNRVIKNKPGDYILVNQSTHLPIAYIYSTKINLQDRVGHEVTIYGSPRDNKNFAFPAYFVLSAE